MGEHPSRTRLRAELERAAGCEAVIRDGSLVLDLADPGRWPAVHAVLASLGGWTVETGPGRAPRVVVDFDEQEGS